MTLALTGYRELCIIVIGFSHLSIIWGHCQSALRSTELLFLGEKRGDRVGYRKE